MKFTQKKKKNTLYRTSCRAAVCEREYGKGSSETSEAVATNRRNLKRGKRNNAACGPALRYK